MVADPDPMNLVLFALIRACQPKPWRRLVIRGKIVPPLSLLPPVKTSEKLGSILRFLCFLL
jgi:hypothetical protein